MRTTICDCSFATSGNINAGVATNSATNRPRIAAPDIRTNIRFYPFKLARPGTLPRLVPT